MTYRRHIPLMLALLLCFGVTLIYQSKLRESNTALAISAQSNQLLKEQNIKLQQSVDELVDDIEKLSNAPPATSEKTPGEAPSILADIYEPESYAPGRDSKIDEIKKRFEEMLVTHYFLQKCKKSGPENYYIILAALAQEMASVNAPGRLQFDILTAAKGSYQEIYAKSSCNDSTMPALERQFAQYIAGLSQNALKQ